MGYANPIDTVAERRYNNEWGLFDNPSQFDVLMGIENCELLGQRGWLIVDDRFYSVQIVDCNNLLHPWPYGYLGDINNKNLNYQHGFLILNECADIFIP